MPEHFAGLTSEAFTFLKGLHADNTKTYFDANRKTYEENAKHRCVYLAIAVEPQDSVSPAIEGEPKLGKSIFRINRMASD